MVIFIFDKHNFKRYLVAKTPLEVTEIFSHRYLCTSTYYEYGLGQFMDNVLKLKDRNQSIYISECDKWMKICTKIALINIQIGKYETVSLRSIRKFLENRKIEEKNK